ncbi:MAG: DUF3336 domain-containing protein, partial [Salinisphaeraceae bacterium]|nr:DUF3336 domain-containing protein [Salinisphaeraceae bacterium]
MKKALKAANAAMHNAASYEEWRQAAAEYDRLTGMDEWKAEDYSPDYNYRGLQARVEEIRRLRRDKDVVKLAFTLNEGLHGNIDNMANPSLYTYAKLGTKHLITEYLREVSSALDWICDNDFEELPFDQKMRFFQRTGRSFGRSALMLSGGATLGMFHIGVLKATFEAGLLPRVLSGSSAGSIIGGAIGTHSDEDLVKMFDPDYLTLQAWRGLGVWGAIRERAIMDGQQLSDCLHDNIGDMTFEEAFEYTGRIINITVSAADQHQQGRMLNYLTSPHVLIRSASLASCAVPGVFPPVELQAKDVNGRVVPYMPGRRWLDGSVESDLPMLRLSRMHNVNHYIVSQTNPHVVPFLTKKDRPQERGLMPFAKDMVSTTSRNTLKLARRHMGPNVVSNMIGKLHSITDQKYSGDINIYPHNQTRKLLMVIANPTPKDIEDFIAEGERATWP